MGNLHECTGIRYVRLAADGSAGCGVPVRYAITLPQFFKNRFHDESGWISVVAAVFILVFFLFYTASGFVSCAKLFSSVFGIPYIVSLLVGAVVVISYTFAGGFFAVCWTDFFQGILMFFCVLAVPTIAIFSMGGPTEFFSQVEAFNPNFLNMLVDGATGVPYTAMGVISLLAWGLGYFGQMGQQIIVILVRGRVVFFRCRLDLALACCRLLRSAAYPRPFHGYFVSAGD